MYPRRIHTLTSAFFITILAAAILISSAVVSRAANVDTTFGTQGRFTTTICGGGVFGGDVYVQPSGRIVYVGSVLCPGQMLSFRSSALVGVTGSGQLDATFGNGGKVQLFGSFSSNEYSGSAMQPDGKILLLRMISIPDGGANYVLARFTADGATDPTFNASVPSGSRTELAVTVATDGKITILAYVPTLSLIRFNSDGSRDQTFGSNGVKLLPSTRLPSTPIRGGMLIDDKGKFSIGFTNGKVIRVDSDGNLDHSFGRQGVAAEYQGSSRGITFSRIVRQPDGKLLLGGSSTNPRNVVLFRYTQRGRPDASLGAGGLAESPVGPGASGVGGLAVQPDGKIIVTGSSPFFGTVSQLLMARFSSDGTLERYSETSYPDLTSGGFAVTVQQNGKIVVAGSAAPPNLLGVPPLLEVVRFNDSNFGAGAIAKLNDFDGDGRTDLSVYRRDPAGIEQSYWAVQTMSGTLLQTYFGVSEDIPVPQDYNDDGKTDVAVFRPSNGTWYYKTDINADTFTAVQFGQAGDIPIPNDYDGDRKADLVVFRPSTATWYIRNSSDGSVTIKQFGDPSQTPVTGDLDGDGKADMTVWNKATARFTTLRSSDGLVFFRDIGAPGDLPVIADYDGDRISDMGTFTPGGVWRYVRSFDGQTVITSFGTQGDIPVPGDYSGDGLADIGVFRPSEGNWIVTWSGNGGFTTQFGQNGDVPLPGR